MSTVTTEAFITPELMEWGRKRYNYSISKLAQKINVNPHQIQAWEKGDERPSFSQAQILAKKLYIPFGYLFLSKPPVDSFPLPDLRTIKGKNPFHPSPDFLDVLYDALRKQEWYHEYLKEEEATTVQFAGKFNPENDPKIIASDIVNSLEIDDDLRETCIDWKQFMRELVRRAEKSRVLVLRSGIVGSNQYRKLDVQEFRGFAISDDLAPLIFINENDYQTAQIFTLVHELAHLWIGNSGISNLDFRSKRQSNQIDQICDHIAAEVLVPSDDFIIRWGDFVGLERNLQRLARHYRVSSFVILRRAYYCDKITFQQYEQLYDALLKMITPKKPEGGHYYKSILSRNSPTLTKSLMAAMGEGHVLPSEVSALINTKISLFNKLEAYIMFG
jgi:Zn-dependent peptidase ImmA (M78 family)/DNA-binding XRE family transcriptional regulator